MMDRLTDLRDELMRDDAFRKSYEARTRLVEYGHRVRHVREMRQLTRAQLAAQLNMTESGITRLENGEGVDGPTAGMRQALAQVLGTPDLNDTP
ncbi:helix-turn-helix transcriptional regulator [Paraburkholderia sp. J10-1]|uniref:helix-turn-helix domain-containing protein n=1 Tax=Paraburkholderia sp. J10-1 TaxID=2805430 RepID=UPI002AB713DA|nr:helix-turn-helix transcriptional regulator [Paraburkholderia sp. J10-1]